jgi:hypothetical protein
VADLQEQYREFELQLADNEAQTQVSPLAQQASGDDLAALNAQIQAQQAILAKLETGDEQNQRAQQAGVGADEALGDHYLEVKRGYDELSTQLEEQKRALALQARSSHE